MKIDGSKVTITIGGREFTASSVEFSDKAEPPQLDRTLGVYVADAGRFFLPRGGPRYPGEGNRHERRAAAKGQVRR